jgi:hypothetical protein
LGTLLGISIVTITAGIGIPASSISVWYWTGLPYSGTRPVPASAFFKFWYQTVQECRKLGKKLGCIGTFIVIQLCHAVRISLGPLIME